MANQFPSNPSSMLRLELLIPYSFPKFPQLPLYVSLSLISSPVLLSTLSTAQVPAPTFPSPLKLRLAFFERPNIYELKTSQKGWNRLLRLGLHGHLNQQNWIS